MALQREEIRERSIWAGVLLSLGDRECCSVGTVLPGDPAWERIGLYSPSCTAATNMSLIAKRYLFNINLLCLPII